MYNCSEYVIVDRAGCFRMSRHPKGSLPDIVFEWRRISMDENMNDKMTEILFKILDAKTMKEKLEMMRLYRDDLDERTLGNIAASYDIVAGYKNNDELFEQIEQYFTLRGKYEAERLR